MKIVRWSGFVLLIVAFLGSMFGGESGIANRDESQQLADEYFQRIQQRVSQYPSQEELAKIVDSLFEAEYIDERVIKIINKRIEAFSYQPWPIDTAPYPAHEFYQDWNNLESHPYPNSLWKNDTAFQLCLTDNYMNCGFAMPIKGTLTSKFGYRDGKMHNGIDLDLIVGDTVVSPFRGVVRLAKWQGGYGRTIIIRHHNGLETIYGHMYRLFVKPGDYVDPGQPIGRGGNSGRSTGSHLHFETRFKGVPLNPLAFIDVKNNCLKSDTLVLKKIPYGFAAFTPGTIFHTVQNGDYLWKIAHQYGLTVKQVCEYNGIRRNKLLVVGEKLKISD